MAFSFHVHNFFLSIFLLFCSFYRKKHDPTTQLIKIIFIFFHQYSIIFSTYTFCVSMLLVIERGKYKHVVRMQMNFALSCELREAKIKVIEVDDKFMCDDALKGRERENQLFPLTLRILFSTVTYSLLISLMHILPYWLTNCIAKKRSACKNHNSAATHNERAFFRENSAFALSHSIILSSGKEYMCT